MIEPYEDKPDTKTKGITLIPTEVANNWIRAADKEGFQIRLHAYGDGAVCFGLDGSVYLRTLSINYVSIEDYMGMCNHHMRESCDGYKDTILSIV